MATLIKVDGTTHEIVPQDKVNGFTLQEVYNAIGCDLVETVYLNNGRIILVDEEGVYNDKEYNEVATAYANSHLNYPLEGLLGNALIVTNEEFQ